MSDLFTGNPSSILERFEVFGDPSESFVGGHQILSKLRILKQSTSADFVYLDVKSRTVYGDHEISPLSYLAENFCDRLLAEESPKTWSPFPGYLFTTHLFRTLDNQELLLVGLARSEVTEKPHQELVSAAAETEWSQSQLEKWINGLLVSNIESLERLVETSLKIDEQDDSLLEMQTVIDSLCRKSEVTEAELGLLHDLTQNLHILRKPAELADICLKQMHLLIESDGNVIWIQSRNDERHFLVEGDMPLEEMEFAQLIARFEDEDLSRPIIRNAVQSTELGKDFPQLKNFLIVPISEGDCRFGWIFCSNHHNNREFSFFEEELLDSIAKILGTHIWNIDLFQQHDELLLGFVRSLVSTLDAKDPYTRGHSERVALIARKLGEEHGLGKKELNDIYLAGLLHDIGKIGVDDRILQKPGELTQDEFKRIQAHPTIGFHILQELKNLHQILPGVRNHHESYNGSGYPDKLVGKEIPLMARILAVADSYDAMSSDRPYRQGLPIHKIEDIFRNGAGVQWDSEIIETYFTVRDEIRNICQQYSPDSRSLLEDMTSYRSDS